MAHDPQILSLSGARWCQTAVDPTRLAEVDTRLSAFAQRCVALRAPAEASDWLEPTLDHLHDPFTMLHMAAAIDRLERALRDGERIRIITDYDVDGTTSSLILQAALRVRSPDAEIDFHIPTRFGEGYGFSLRAAEHAIADGVALVVTADIGVRDHAAVARCAEAGVDVLICDHHLPAGADVPVGATVLCPPQRGCTYPNRHLAACGVSLKVAQALLGRHPKRHAIVRSMCKLAAVGTVADMVPLTTVENRAIVLEGLAALNEDRHHPGLAALLEVSQLERGAIRTSDLGFRIGPRINAAGRLDDAALVVKLLSCRDPGVAQSMAAQLDAMNRQRRDIQKQLVEDALGRIPDPVPDFVVVSGPEAEGWHRGVVGIVAARVKDEVHRPTAVVSIQGELAVGSVRSVPGVHAVQALDSVAELLVKYGGHPAAAGFTVRADQLDVLAERLASWTAEHISDDALVAVHRWDGDVDAAQLGPTLFHELERLGPFGQGNPRPRMRIRDVIAQDIAVLGRDQSLLKFRVPRPGRWPIEAVWWHQAQHAEALALGPIDVLARLSEHRWKGRARLQLEVVDVRRSAGSPA